MSIAVLGEALIDLITGDDGSFRPCLGGSPYNVAIGLARQGVVRKCAYPVANVVDTVGAGDVFHASFLAFLCRSHQWSKTIADIDIETLGDALDFACAAAALNVARTGCSPPTQAEVTEFIAATGR